MDVVKTVLIVTGGCFFILLSPISVVGDCENFASSEIDVSAYAGDIVSLPCFVDSDSVENRDITWLRNSVNISMNNKIIVTESRYSLSLSTLLYDFTLRIEKATYLDNGEYECRLDTDIIQSYTLCVANSTSGGNNQTESATTMAKNLTAIRNAHKVILLLCLIIVMFGSGFGITLEKDWKDLFYPYELLLFTFCQFGIMPLVGFVLAHILYLDKSAALGTLVVACCPGIVTATLFFRWIGIKDTVLSVSMIVTSVFLSSIMIPLWLFVYSRSWIDAQDLPYGYLFLTVLLSLAIPLALGVIIGKKTSEWSILVIINVCSGVGAVGIVVSLILQALEKPEVFAGSNWNLWLVAALFPFLGFMLGYLFPCCFCLAPDLKIIFSLELGLQNVLLALVFFAFIPFSQKLDTIEMMSVPGLYGVFMLLEGFLFFVLYNLTQSKHQKSARKKLAKRDQEVYTLPVDLTASQNLSIGTGLSSSGLIYYENYGFSDTSSTNRSIDSRRRPLAPAPVVSFDTITEGEISIMSSEKSIQTSDSHHEVGVIGNQYIDDDYYDEML